ncbi:uncharacterized protein DS421_5g151870 [Arachis hypogaea]|nr:uncharacterized protein DS421_5g151870 [Arachis hypogaea]
MPQRETSRPASENHKIRMAAATLLLPQTNTLNSSRFSPFPNSLQHSWLPIAMKETEIRSRGWRGSQSRASGEEKRERRASSGGPRRRRPAARRSPPTSKKKEIRIGSEEGRVSCRAVALPSPRRVAAPSIVLTAPHNELRSLATRCILPVPFFTPSRSFVAAAVDRRGSLIRERSEGRASPEESLNRRETVTGACVIWISSRVTSTRNHRCDSDHRGRLFDPPELLAAAGAVPGPVRIRSCFVLLFRVVYAAAKMCGAVL